jgi:hypothetical protein
LNATYTSLPSREIVIHGLSVHDLRNARRKLWKPVHVRPWSADRANTTLQLFIHAA